MIIWTDTLDKMQYSLLIESQQTRNRGRLFFFFNLVKCIYKKPSAGIILSGEQWNAFCLTSRREWCPLSLTISVQDSIGACSQKYARKKKNKQHPYWEGRSKIIFIHRWHDYVEFQWNLQKKLLKSIVEFIHGSGYKISVFSTLVLNTINKQL